ncbi:unnamed protein product [Amoebophrya sp. A25]|nr:unnamed protein product [Amoebophrya sp. A25]|eukprot:GSA25T00009563001.1
MAILEYTGFGRLAKRFCCRWRTTWKSIGLNRWLR